MTAIDSTTVTRDAFGRTVEFKGSTTRQFLYAPSGVNVAKMNGQNLDTARVPLPGGEVADYHASGFNAYGHADWLGSTRFGSTSTRTKDDDWAVAPFGEVYAGGATSYTSFTAGQFSDIGSLLWDFPMREYHSSLGRWISPDPAGLAAVNPVNPQSWNRYAYVVNNPLIATDPTGLFLCVICGFGTEGGLPDEAPYPGDSVGPDPFVFLIGHDRDDPDRPILRRGSASNNGPTISAAPPTPWYKNSCITSALGDEALHVGIDAIGLIPEAGGLARVIGHQAGYVGVVADQLGARVIGGVGGSVATIHGLAGLGDTSPEGLVLTGLTVAGFIPGLGQAAAVGSIGVDVYKTVKAIGQCH